MIGMSTDEHNPQPPGTAPEGGNEPVSNWEAIHALLGKYPTGFPVIGQRISKHRAGRAKSLTKEQRRKRDRRDQIHTQARKHLWLEHQADVRALAAAFEDR